MFEILLIVAVIVAMARIASADDQSVGLWVGVTILFCVLSFLIPLPFLRIFIAGIAAFAAMFIYKMVKS